MAILISTPTLFVSGALFIVVVVLSVALVKAHRRIGSLRALLEAASLRRESDRLELTQRSELDTIKDEFVSNVSHELRTPLTSIRGALGLVEAGVLGTVDAQAHKLLRIALSNTERLIRLINDILDLQRMESGLSVLQVRRCSLPDLVHQAIETMSAMADSAEVKLTVAPAAKAILPSIFFDGDSDRILQVLTNLLSNAIKFSPAGSAVTIEIEAPPDALIFSIVDQGRGIPEAQLETIFERFKQVEPADSSQRRGTGLGLAICRSIIEQHGGTIWAQRNPTRGVSVCVKLPRAQRTNDAIPQDPATAAASMEAPSRNAGSAVLICDDDEAHRTITAQQLRAHGHTVFEASSSDEAIDIARRRPVHSPLQAILLDLQMSDMKGWELLRVLNRNASTSTIPIAVLSVECAPGTTERAGTLPSDDHLFADLGRAIDSGRGSTYVLLVEDDDDLASVVLGGFARSQVLVHHAATLDRAMACCRDRRPDLMILDLTLPDGDGFAMVEWLRARPALRSMPLIVYSGREVAQEDRAKLRLGPTRFLTKARVQVQDVEQLVLSMVHKTHASAEGTTDRSPGVFPYPGVPSSMPTPNIHLQ